MPGPFAGTHDGAHDGAHDAARGKARDAPGQRPRDGSGVRRLGDLLQDLLAVEWLRLEAAVDRRLTYLVVVVLMLLGSAAALVVAAGLLVSGLAGATAAAFGTAPWIGDLAVGLALPGVVIGAVLLAHRRRARRRLSRAERLAAGDPGSGSGSG